MVNDLSITQRILKYKFHYIIVIPAIILLLIFKVCPLVYGFILSMTDYKVFIGLQNSDWIGFNNFNNMFSEQNFLHVLTNTLVIKIGYILVSSAVAFIIALAISSIGYKWLRQFFVSLFLIPFFIPSVVFAYVAIFWVSPSQSPFFQGELFVLGDPVLFPIFLILVEVLKTCGIPIVIALAAIASKHSSASTNSKGIHFQELNYIRMNVIPALKAVVAFMILQMSVLLTTDPELIHSLLNPLVYESGDVISTYNFRIGLLNMQISLSAAAGVIQFVLQLLLTIAAYFIVKGSFFNELFSSTTSKNDVLADNKGRGIAGTFIAGLCAIAALLPIYFLFVSPFVAGKEEGSVSLFELLPIGNFILFLIINLAAVMIYLLITVTLAYPLTVKALPGRGLYKLFLIVLLVMSTGSVNEYMFFHNMELTNTIFPQLFTGFFNLVSVFVLKSIFNSKYSALKAEAEASDRGELSTFFTIFIPKMWKPLLALGILQFISLWNSYLPSLMYISDPKAFSPIMRFAQLMQSGEQNVPLLLQMGALLSLPALVLFLLFRKWITSEVLISQIRKL